MLCMYTSLERYNTYGTIHEDRRIIIGKIVIVSENVLGRKYWAGSITFSKIKKRERLFSKSRKRERKRLKRRRWMEIYLLNLENSRPM